ncbi:uncharacterized protein N7518_003133 [Penicillium psychrosexuale]|uniref:uncharacterized protein n=1 Tax=Penicillium psychrosexuale TaxID=1002107 RepID=UPI00254533F6|nr:uncharacterized protein N7518_003133 [Penicillium psychrosexuale]KAJ5801065.1 hypothetical protein N7518_003133 [Penicillium psychrosexuale]
MTSDGPSSSLDATCLPSVWGTENPRRGIFDVGEEIMCDGVTYYKLEARYLDHEKGLSFGLKVVEVVTLALVLREAVLLTSWWIKFCTKRRYRRADARAAELAANRDATRTANANGTQRQAGQGN